MQQIQIDQSLYNVLAKNVRFIRVFSRMALKIKMVSSLCYGVVNFFEL